MPIARCRLAGVLTGRLTADLTEPLAGAGVRLRRPACHSAARRSVDSPDAAGCCDEAGAFVIEFCDADAPTRIELTAVVPAAADGGAAVEIPLGAVEPVWRLERDGFVAEWEGVIDADEWARARSALDRWTILGRVSGASGEGLGGVLVTAIDRDLAVHDGLGHAVTDEHGGFRIDYSSAVFQPPAPLHVVEGGPDICFRIEQLDGAVLLDEIAAGRTFTRRNAGRLMHAELRLP